MEKKIIFQKCNIYNLYFLFHIIISCLDYLFTFYFYQEKIQLIKGDVNKTDYYLPTQMIILYKECLSNFLAIIPHLIRRRLVRKKEQWIQPLEINDDEDDKKNTADLPLIYNDNKISESQKNNKKILWLCVLVSVLDFLAKFTIVLYHIIVPDKYLDIHTFSCLVPFEITLQFIFSYFILKIHFYKLQYLSLFVNLGIFIILLIIDVIDIKITNPNRMDGNAYFFFAFNIIFISLEFSYVKKILLDGFISIYLLMIIKGVFELILTVIFSLILFLTKRDGLYKRVYFLIKDVNYILLIIINIFLNFLENLFAWLIIDKFSPNYYPFVLIFQEIGSAIVDAVKENEKDFKKEDKDKRKWWDLVLRIILYIFSAICAILHNEIVVINICDLGSDTKYFLDLKVESEILYANTDDIDVIKEYETVGETVSEKSDKSHKSD